MIYELCPHFVPPVRFASKSGGGVMSPSSYGSAAHGDSGNLTSSSVIAVIRVVVAWLFVVVAA